MSSFGILAILIVLGTLAHWFRRAWRVDIPVSPRPYQIACAVGVALALLALAGAGGAPAWTAFALGTLFLYLSVTGAQRTDDAAITVGATIPAFTAVDDEGNPFDSASLAGSRVLLKFFRGHW